MGCCGLYESVEELCLQSRSNQVSYDHRSYERNLSNCVKKTEKVRTSTGLNP